MDGNTSFNGDIWGHNPPRLCLGIRYTRQDMFSHCDVLSGSLCSVPEVALTGGGAALTVIRRWRCAYHRLMAVIPSGSRRGTGRFIYPTGGGADRRWRCAYHRLMAGIPPGSKRGAGRFIYPTGGGADRRWRFAYHRLMAGIPPGSKRGTEFNRDICGRIAHRLCRGIRCILRGMF